ncbi:PqiA/YebS family transporter subunit [Neisseria sp. Ec49-e6-T10]|uniref:PqiA/YebS family transporter subunit n=1 Tax=Neisseria sp. Ec49-e6-T10 TaxID=3140744 RepID=UPI003EBCB820
MKKLLYSFYQNICTIKTEFKKPGDFTCPSHDVCCPDCGHTVCLPEIRNGQNAHCPICHHQLISISYSPYLSPIAFSTAALIFMFLSFCFTFMGVQVGAASFYLSLPEAAGLLFKDEYDFLANILLIFLFAAPLMFLLSNLFVYHSLYFKHDTQYLDKFMFLVVKIKPWVMIDIFVISVFVAMVKIRSVADMHFGLSFWALICFSLCLVRSSIFVHPHWLYFQLKQLKTPDFQPHKAENHALACKECFFFNDATQKTCTVCHHSLRKRAPKSIQITLALLISAIILYFPANLFPMMITITPFNYIATNILEGIIYMWNNDSKFIAAVIFSASLMVPLVKMVAIVILLISAKIKPLAPALVLTKLYRIIEFIGRWSMVDVFVVVLMVTLVQIPGAKVLPGEAVMYFCAVVVLSMIAVTKFDIRLVWDKIVKDK